MFILISVYSDFFSAYTPEGFNDFYTGDYDFYNDQRMLKLLASGIGVSG